MYTKKFYLHEIAAVDISKIYFLKNEKKTCKPNNLDFKSRLKKKLRNKEPFLPLLCKLPRRKAVRITFL